MNREVIVNAQFIELYNEEVNDLLDTGSLFTDQIQDYNLVTSNYTPAQSAASTYRPKIEIHEDQYGGIVINGCSNRNVSSVEETLEILRNGAKIRTTGSTNPFAKHRITDRKPKLKAPLWRLV